MSRCFISTMSAEKVIITDANDLPPLVAPKGSEEVSSSGRVDINILLNRARKIKEKETIKNLIYLGLSLFLIFLVGIILSL